jgi:predicted choloylglycine hydrolase
VFFGAGGTPIMGRNFDFHDEPALILHHRPPGAYPSVSVVDISYLGFDRKHLDGVSADGLKDASRLPFDGMNSQGVAVAMAAVPRAEPPSGRKVGSLGVMRLVLDHAANVGDLGQQRIVHFLALRPRREVHRLSRADEVTPEMIGEERHHRRHDTQRLCQ